MSQKWLFITSEVLNYKAFFLFYSSDSSSSSSDDSPARSVQSAAVPAPTALPLSSLDKDEPRKSFGIKVQNLPVRSTGQLHGELSISDAAMYFSRLFFIFSSH